MKRVGKRSAGKLHAAFDEAGAGNGLTAPALDPTPEVVIDWCIYYFVRMATGNLPQSVDTAMGIWDNYQQSYWPLFFHTIVMCLGTLVIWKGIKSIERVNTILMPILFCIIVISLIRALTLEGAGEGLSYLE